MDIYLGVFLVATALSAAVFFYLAWKAREVYHNGVRAKRLGSAGRLLRMVGYLSAGLMAQYLFWSCLFILPLIVPDLRDMPWFRPISVATIVITELWTAFAALRLWRTIWPSN